LLHGLSDYVRHDHWDEIIFTLTGIIWFGASLLLVIAGLRRGNALGRIGSVCAVAFLFYLAEPIHGIGRSIGNLFRKNEYAMIYPGAPECRVTAVFLTDREGAAFLEAVRQFARTHDVHECRQKRYTVYLGPPRPNFKGDHVAIWSSTVNAGGKIGWVRLAPFDEAYPVSNFKQLADSMASTMHSAFPDRIEVSYKEAETR
jgi:hypothetical protein